MKAAERERRDVQVLRLFLAGASYRIIAGAVGLRSPQSVGNIVARALEGSSQRRELLTDEAFAVWQERTERLLNAHWVAALAGDHRSAEVCRKILAQHVLVYGLAQEVSLAGTQTDAVEVDPEPDPDDPDGLDVLERSFRKSWEASIRTRVLRQLSRQRDVGVPLPQCDSGVRLTSREEGRSVVALGSQHRVLCTTQPSQSANCASQRK